MLGPHARGPRPADDRLAARHQRPHVSGHVKSLLLKLGAHSQLEAVVIAAREGLLTELSDQRE